MSKKMLPQFGDDFYAACEPIARIWHKGNEPIGRCPIAVIDVHLPEIHAISFLLRNIEIVLTVLAVLNVLLLATIW